MAKDPAFLFYSSDFLTGTLLMSFEDRGKYITILSLMHQQGRLDEETIRLLVGSVSDKLKRKFLIDENEFWYNERLEIEIEKRNKFTESRRNNGLLGGRPKEIKKPIGKPKKNLKDNHMGNHMEDENINENILKNTFENFRIKYPGSKLGLNTEYENLIKKHSDYSEIIPTLFNVIENQIKNKDARKSQKMFVPEWKNLKTWINNRCWEEVQEPTEIKPYINPLSYQNVGN